MEPVEGSVQQTLKQLYDGDWLQSQYDVKANTRK